MRYKTLPIGLLAAISIINSTVLPASANPRRTRQDSYEACIEQTYRDWDECSGKAQQEAVKNGSIAFASTPGTAREKGIVAIPVAAATLAYSSAECFYEYTQNYFSCKSEARQRRSRKRRQRNARRSYRKRTSRRTTRANY